MERSVVLVKPDGVQRGLIGDIISRFEHKGLKLAAIKMVQLDDAILDKWYAHHKDKPFFGNLKSFMKSYPIVAMLWEGYEAANAIRLITGSTKAREADAGTIRGDFAMSTQLNLIHSSENREAAEYEEKIMFSPEDIFSWERVDYTVIYAEDER